MAHFFVITYSLMEPVGVNGSVQSQTATSRTTSTGRKTSTGKAAEVETLIESTLDAMGFCIVRVMLSGGRGQQRLQVMVERADGQPMDADACAEASRACSALLDVSDPIAGAYDLEVSSPGIDRPLTRLSDFAAWAGFDARIEMADTHAGRRRFKGRLVGVGGPRDGTGERDAAGDGDKTGDGDAIHIVVDGETWALPFAEIAKAKLVLTDALIAAVQGETQA